MIRVLNVMEDGRIAGPQLRMLRVAKRLEDKVESIIAIPINGPQDFKNALEAASVPFVQLPLTKLSRSPREIVLSMLRLPWEVSRLVKYIKSEKIDVVHSSGGAWMYKAIIAAKLAGCPSIWHLNDTSSPAPFRLLARLLMRHWVTGVIVAGSRVKEHYLPDFDAVYRNKVELLSIEAPVDTTLFVPQAESAWEGQIIRVLTVGNVSPVKDYMAVVHACSLLTEPAGIHWRIIGSSFKSQEKYRASLDAEIQRLHVENLSFVGPSSDIEGQLQQSDIYVCSSAAEASPTSVWEAMACGLPIVSTDVGCVRDYVHEGVNGFLVSPGDSQAMAQKIILLANDKALRMKMGKANRKKAVESLDLGVCAASHATIYELSVERFEGS